MADIIFFKFQVVPSAIKEWELALNVKRAQGPILLNRKCKDNQYFLVDEDPGEQYCKETCVITKCGEFAVPESHLKPCKTCDANGRRCRENSSNRKSAGVDDADFVLYVSAMPTPQCQETIGKLRLTHKSFTISAQFLLSLTLSFAIFAEILLSLSNSSSFIFCN